MECIRANMNPIIYSKKVESYKIGSWKCISLKSKLTTED